VAYEKSPSRSSSRSWCVIALPLTDVDHSHIAKSPLRFGTSPSQLQFETARKALEGFGENRGTLERHAEQQLDELRKILLGHLRQAPTQVLSIRAGERILRRRCNKIVREPEGGV